MSTTKSSKKTAAADSYEKVSNKLADSAVKLIDQAASLLKKGVLTGAEKSVVARQNAKKKAMSLVNKATKELDKALKEGSNVLRKGIRKL